MTRIYTRMINFDGLKDATRIDDIYADVSFASISTNPPKKWSAFVRASTDADTAPNTLDIKKSGLFVGFDAQEGGIEATFKLPQRFVSIRAKPYTKIEIPPKDPPTSRPFVEFFNVKGNLITERFYPFFLTDAGWGTWQTIEFLAASKSDEIKKIIFSSQFSEPHVFSEFDTLIYANENPDFQHIQPGPLL
jgi:hypothetical protein